ncbi:MAG: polyprenol monophosphomannose synthase [Actinobacteria bacterium]|nr:polyprenol monophosphomannose synthase [Actinomycetota bacterium]
MRASLVVIPTYNEAESIGLILDALKNLDLDVLVIDDGSPDGTADIVRMHGVEVIGLGSAYRTGFSIAIQRGYSYVIEMDADGSHQVADLEKMMEWIGSADLLIGSRYVKDGAVTNWSKFRENLSKTANLYSTILLSLGIKDSTSGFRIYTSELLNKMEISTIRSEGYCFQIEMTRRAISRGGSVAEIPITFIERAHGVSKMSFAIALEAVLRITAWGALRLIGR